VAFFYPAHRPYASTRPATRRFVTRGCAKPAIIESTATESSKIERQPRSQRRTLPRNTIPGRQDGQSTSRYGEIQALPERGRPTTGPGQAKVRSSTGLWADAAVARTKTCSRELRIGVDIDFRSSSGARAVSRSVPADAPPARAFERSTAAQLHRPSILYRTTHRSFASQHKKKMELGHFSNTKIDELMARRRRRSSRPSGTTSRLGRMKISSDEGAMGMDVHDLNPRGVGKVKGFRPGRRLVQDFTAFTGTERNRARLLTNG